MEYNAILTVAPGGASPVNDDDAIDTIMDGLTDFHPSVSPASGAPGAWAATITLDAADLGQAITIARALAAPLGALEAIEVVPTEVFDRRAGIDAVDSLDAVGVTEAADALGITGQAVRDRIAAGTLPARKIGRNWAIPTAALHHTKEVA
ncbi:DNA-binding protein [Actinomyces sp. 432]|uniref:helix-turn-helix domain-containing protein n=1 Tax=Actinomyces sp. 432 TaxID=2057798 RepID=UPI0013744BAE|nr:helix-turn-helix domain-containing protein [Actinomyces sp. 432]QHO90282.1 DNA-binding protein [Actinomyces sp. 432]